MKEQIETKLINAFAPTFLSVEDESHLHVSHGPYQAGGGSHFKVTLIAAIFTGCRALERHRKVYACLEEELKNGVHALRLKLHSPEEVE
jgi:BolA protein